jgi:hypothetical protein
MAALRITQQPDEIFFKEEGGASHTLRVTVTHPAGAPPPTVPLPLAFTLLLEDGELGPSNFLKIKQVHPKSSIDESNTIYLSVAAPQVAVEFRIEQVTQKVKKKFVVRISPDYDRLGALPQPEERWGAVFTVPITVKSKRPIDKRHDAPTPPGAPPGTSPQSAPGPHPAPSGSDSDEDSEARPPAPAPASARPGVPPSAPLPPLPPPLPLPPAVGAGPTLVLNIMNALEQLKRATTNLETTVNRHQHMLDALKRQVGGAERGLGHAPGVERPAEAGPSVTSYLTSSWSPPLAVAAPYVPAPSEPFAPPLAHFAPKGPRAMAGGTGAGSGAGAGAGDDLGPSSPLAALAMGASAALPPPPPTAAAAAAAAQPLLRHDALFQLSAPEGGAGSGVVLDDPSLDPVTPIEWGGGGGGAHSSKRPRV